MPSSGTPRACKEELERVLGLDLPVDDWAKEEGIADEELRERIERRADERMAAKVAQWGPDVMRYVEKSILLQTLDHLWREHLVMLDHLRQVIGLRGYGQRDPLNEYKAEAFSLFEAMIAAAARGGDRAADAGRDRAGAAAEEPPQSLPLMEAHHIDPRPARTRWRWPTPRWRRRWPATARRRAAAAQSERSDDLGQGRPQRALPVRLGQEVQALPRQFG